LIGTTLSGCGGALAINPLLIPKPLPGPLLWWFLLPLLLLLLLLFLPVGLFRANAICVMMDTMTIAITAIDALLLSDILFVTCVILMAAMAQTIAFAAGSVAISIVSCICFSTLLSFRLILPLSADPIVTRGIVFSCLTDPIVVQGAYAIVIIVLLALNRPYCRARYCSRNRLTDPFVVRYVRIYIPVSYLFIDLMDMSCGLVTDLISRSIVLRSSDGDQPFASGIS